MGRINLEDCFWTDPRRAMLVEKIGEDAAIGACIRLWKLAQFYWLKDRLIPFDIFEKSLPAELLDFDFAERREGGIYARGSEQYFSWLKQRIGAGKRSGDVRRLKSLENQRTESNGIERNTNGNEPLTLAPAPAPTLKNKDKEIYIQDQKTLKAGASECQAEWQKTLRHFGIPSGMTAHTQTAIARAVQRFGADEVRFALIGARHEKAGEGFNPAQHVSLARYLDPAKLERFRNLGAAAAEKEREKDKTAQALVATREREEKQPDTWPAQNPGKVREILSGLFGAMPGATPGG